MIPTGVYPTWGTGTAVHLYLPDYANPNANRARSVTEAPLCGSGTIRGTKKSPRELATIKALRKPWRWCALCVGRWLEASGQLAAVMARTIQQAQDAERADLERATPLTASEPPVSTTDAGRQRAYVGHGFTPSSGPFEPDSCRVQLSRYPCPDGRDAHDPSLPPEDLDAFGRIRRADLERGEADHD